MRTIDLSNISSDNADIIALKQAVQELQREVETQSNEIEKINLPEVEELLDWDGNIYDNPISSTLRDQIVDKGGFVYDGCIFRLWASENAPGAFGNLLQALENAQTDTSASYFIQYGILMSDGDINSLTAAILYRDDYSESHILKIEI